MLLKSSCNNKCVNSKNDNATHSTTNNSHRTTMTKQINAVAGRRDPLKGTECPKVTITHNNHLALTNEDGDDDDSDNNHNHNKDDDNGNGCNWILVEHKTANFNRRQRAKRRASIHQQRVDHSYDDDEAIRGAAA